MGMTTQGITPAMTGTGGAVASLSGTAGVSASQEYYNTQNTTYYSNNFAT